MRVAALKLAAIFSYCGGPLFLCDLLKPSLTVALAFSITFLPVLLMVLGAFCLEDARSRWTRAGLRAGRLGVYAVLTMNVYAVWCFAHGVRVPDQTLHYIGIAVGLVWTAVYLWEAHRWESAAGKLPAGERATPQPIEPS